MHSENEVVYLYLDDIIPNRFQPREVFDERALKELAVSIKEHGVIQPIIVRKIGEKYEIIAGERRYKASAMAGLTKIPAIVRDLDDKESSKIALLENLQRKNLNAIEEAKTYQKILELDQMTQEELARTMGKSQSAVANKLRLLSLPEEVQKALLKDKISERHARTLLKMSNPEKQIEYAQRISNEKITVRDLERLINKENNINQEIELPLEEEPQEDTYSSKETNSPKEVQSEKEEPIVKKELPKFINYGEIDPDLEEEEDKIYMKPTRVDNDFSPTTNNTNNNAPIKQSSSDLDSLLNIKAPIKIDLDDEEEPQEELDTETDLKAPTLNTDLNLETEDTEKEYEDFDLYGEQAYKNISNENVNHKNNSSYTDALKAEVKDKHLVANPQSKELDINDAIQELRNTISDLQKQGINIETDEMSLEKSYQMMIKINKE